MGTGAQVRRFCVFAGAALVGLGAVQMGLVGWCVTGMANILGGALLVATNVKVRE